jgi:hypothetical protein
VEEEEVEAAVCACHTRRSAVSGRQRYLPIHRPAAALLSSAGRGSASDAAAPVILIGAPVEQEHDTTDGIRVGYLCWLSGRDRLIDSDSEKGLSGLMKSAVAAAWERRIDQPHSPGAFRRIGNLEPCGQENLNAVRAVFVCLLHHVQDASGFDALSLQIAWGTAALLQLVYLFGQAWIYEPWFDWTPLQPVDPAV